jgi:hypothetical protein
MIYMQVKSVYIKTKGTNQGQASTNPRNQVAMVPKVFCRLFCCFHTICIIMQHFKIHVI